MGVVTARCKGHAALFRAARLAQGLMGSLNQPLVAVRSPLFGRQCESVRLQLLILALPSALQDAQGRVDMLAELGCCGLQFCRDVAGMWLCPRG